MADTTGILTDSTIIVEEHAAAIRRLGKQTIENIIEIGRHLTEAKRIVGPGNWLPWLDREFGWTEMTATRFIHVFELSKSNKLLDLDLPLSGLYLLAAPSTPEPAKTEVIERAQAGETLSVADVKQTIDTAKGRQQPARKTPRAKPQTAPSKTSAEQVIADKPNASRFDADVLLGPLKPTHERAAWKLFKHFDQAPGEVQRHFLGVIRQADDIGPARDDIGHASAAEADRLRELEAENAALRQKIELLEGKLLVAPSADDIEQLRERDETIAALRRRITELEHAAATRAPPPPADANLDPPAFLDRRGGQVRQ
jgi:hypothetical protein